jgi:hypothetical protein
MSVPSLEDLGDLNDADTVDAGDLHEEPSGTGVELGTQRGDGERGGKPAGDQPDALCAIGRELFQLVKGGGDHDVTEAVSVSVSAGDVRATRLNSASQAG